jgi:hypothetical protein
VTKPKPIPPDPARDGAWQVVVSFRVNGPFAQPWTWDEFWFAVRRWGDEFAHGVDRESESHAVRKIGAAGERSQMEGKGP